MKPSSAKPKQICPDIRSTPGWHRRLFGRHARAMPDDLLKEASERLGITALIVATLWDLAVRVVGQRAADALRRLPAGRRRRRDFDGRAPARPSGGAGPRNGQLPGRRAVGEPVDAPADICALGCVACYHLTARLVFEAENGVQVMLKHVTESPVPPSVRVGRATPEWLDQVVLACLAREPPDRPQGALELGRMLAPIPGVGWSQEPAAESWRTTRG
jgi:serine/threonine protein kinase